MIEVQLFFATKVRRDVDNYGKLLLDALSGIAAGTREIAKMSIEKA